MAAVVCLNPSSPDKPLASAGNSTNSPPLNFFYSHFHNSIRAELSSLSLLALAVERVSDGELEDRLVLLKDRYHFLEQIYKYHSSVEDEVVYPALDSKVKNVTLAYSVEHQGEEVLFEQLSQLLSDALASEGSARLSIVRRFVCKVEEINTTLRRHLAKEEEQLLPLLLQHFNYAEQAELVAQFLYCIPLATVEKVLTWLRPMVPQEEQTQLLTLLQDITPDHLLIQLLSSWLGPTRQEAATPGGTSGSPILMAQDEASTSAATGGEIKPPPLRGIVLLHDTIGSALENFALEAEALQSKGDASPAALSALVERHRFLRSVCMFHTLSEEEVMIPAALKMDSLSGGSTSAVCAACQADHRAEVSLFEELGRLLLDVRAFVRRGRREVSSMLADLCVSAQQVCAALRAHMSREETGLLPLLEQHLSPSEQRSVVWLTLRAMPLRLLERVMPWIMAKISEDDGEELLRTMKLGATEGDAILVELLCRWAERGRASRRLAGRGQEVGPHGGLPPPVAHNFSSDDMWLYTESCGPCQLAPYLQGQGGMEQPAYKKRRLTAPGEAAAEGPGSSTDTTTSGGTSHALTLKMASREYWTSGSGVPCHDTPEEDLGLGGGSSCGQFNSRALPTDVGLRGAQQGAKGLASTPLDISKPQHYNPIDHIFQFHKALRQELSQLEQDAINLETSALGISVEAEGQTKSRSSTCNVPGRRCDSCRGDWSCWPGEAGRAMRVCQQAVQKLDGRFQFLRGIYRAHSKAEDDIVFPALESKEALHNVSHAYTLDHQQEEQLFVDLNQVLEAVRSSVDLREVRELSLQIRRMCAAIRASLEMHVRAEESELWPLFSEHFTVEEQQYLVGVIIGRTGAEVLQAMLPWVTDSFTLEEKDAMMESLREATKHTMFDQWLGAIQGSGGEHQEPQDQGTQGAEDPAAGELSDHKDLQQPLAEVAEYLAGGAGGGEVLPEVSGTVSEASTFRPGWEDIFRMNQQQLEAAIRRVSTDPKLEPKRKAYLIQNIMVSRYIVSQQKRMTELEDKRAAARGLGGDALQAEEAAAKLVDGLSLAMSEGPSKQLGPGLRDVHTVPRKKHVSQADMREYHDPLDGHLGCRHYKRRCKLVAACCRKAFTCRLCHDEQSDHKMDRYAVTEMVCMLCGLQQPVGSSCSGCLESMADYYCNICHLFDNEPGRAIYHCPFCNVCRRGKGLGFDFFHCMNCNACMSLTLFNKHKCREKCMEGNCPVCHEYLFDSSEPIKELPCGHFLHSSCFASYTKYNYTCPICAKSIGDMTVYFQMLDTILSRDGTSLPPEYASRMQSVLCHDCGRQGLAPFHFVYHACPYCRSYNTRVL